LIVGLGLVGYLDDWLKVVKQRSLGLKARQKLLGQAVVAGIWAWAAQHAGQVMAEISLEIRRATMLKILQLA